MNRGVPRIYRVWHRNLSAPTTSRFGGMRSSLYICSNRANVLPANGGSVNL